MKKIARSLAGLHLPRYQELPQMGLYLEQTATYINEALAPLENVHLTSSMVSNYVKHDLIASPKRSSTAASRSLSWSLSPYPKTSSPWLTCARP